MACWRQRMNSYLDYIVKDADTGGFHAVASSSTVDRDGDLIEVGAFSPLPDRIPTHLGHDFSKLCGSCRPYYDGDDLLVDGTFARNALGKEARDLVLAGHLTTMSIVFHGAQSRPTGKDGIRRIYKGEL